MIEKKTWKDFQDCGLLWWTNRILHTFGWAIVFGLDDEGTVVDVYPARVSYRGFSTVEEEIGFMRVSEQLKENANKLFEEARMY